MVSWLMVSEFSHYRTCVTLSILIFLSLISLICEMGNTKTINLMELSGGLAKIMCVNT